MSLIRISITAILCALVAAVSASTTILSKLSEMDPFDQLLYENSYACAANRHGSRSAFSAAPTAVWTGASTNTGTMSGERAESIIRELVSQIFWALFKYSLYAFLLWCLVGLVPWIRLGWALGEWIERTAEEIAPQIRAGLRGWLDLFVLLVRHLVRAVIQHPWLNHARQAVRDRLRQTRQIFDRIYDILRHNWLTAAIYLQYQQVINWFGRHKLHLIVFVFGIHLLSTMIQSQIDKSSDVFMKWTELQRYIEDPIPQHLFQQQVKDRSTSHYRREASWWPDNTNVIDEAEPGLMERISVEPITTILLQDAIAAPPTTEREENDQTAPRLVSRISAVRTTITPWEDDSTPAPSAIEGVENDEKAPGLASRISAARITTTLSEDESTAAPFAIAGDEIRQTVPGDQVAFCRQCRQEHCCEVFT